MRSSNPVFASIERAQTYSSAETASFAGITIKTFSLLLIAIVSGFVGVTMIDPSIYPGLLFGSLIVALIAVIVGSRSVHLAMPMSIVYAIAEGLVLGFITVLAEVLVPGASYVAVIATVAIFFVMLFLYSSRVIRVTARFQKIMYAILLGILLYFILSGILSIFFPQIVGMMSSGLGIGITGFLIIYGAFMLTLDFDRAEALVASGADKRSEWMVSMGLMVTIIWLYIEILRLIIILSNRRN
jgi:uncharacterized YccA/Bax inhibitor family protein